MNYLKCSSIIMVLLFVSLICVNSSFASDSLYVESSNLDSNLTTYSCDSINTKSDLKNLNSLNTQDLGESFNEFDEYNKLVSMDISIKNYSANGYNYSSNINSVNAISGNTFNDIQNAINNAKNGDNIILNNIIYSGKGSFILVNKSVNIIGNGAILNANGNSVIMKVNDSKVNITNIQFINGYSEKWADAGALILLENSNYCTISNCVFKNNTAQQGTVFVVSDYAKFLDCNFTNNIGISILNGTIYNKSARMSGGLNIDNNGSYGYVSGCIFKGNIGRAGGGASLRGDYNTIENCTFIQNSVNEGSYDRDYGGALHVGPNNESLSTASIFNCVFINNSVYSEEHKGHGGALCFADGSVMENCTFINNYCEGIGGATTLHGSGTLSNCIFINCTATINGGAITTGYNELRKWTANFVNCVFEGNAAPVGGAVCAIGDGINFFNSTFIRNIAVSGGAIYIEGDNSSFNNLSVINNSGDIGGAFYIEGNNANINNSFLDYNSANIGGAVNIIGDNSHLINLNISYNIAKYGGGVYINGSNTLVSNVIFINNQAIPLKDTPYNDSHMDDGIGGGAFINGINTTIENTIFSSNSARNGSGVYLSGSKMKFINVSTEEANKAWSYLLPLEISLNPNGTISFNITHFGGNNINGGNQSTNYIYLNASNEELIMDSLTPVDTVENSANGIKLFKDTREQYQNINVYIFDKEGNVYGSFSGLTNLYGFFSGELNISNLYHNLLYTISVTHEDDTFYSYITNSSYFTIPEPLVNKTADKDIVFKDEIINYNLTIENIAPLKANFLVTDIIPEYFVYQGTNLTPIYEYDDNNHRIVWNITLPAESVCIINIWGYSNKSNINLTNSIEVYNPDTNISVKADSMVLVLPEANLDISVVPDKQEVNKGDNITWKVNVINNGPDSACNLSIMDLFDSSLMEFVSCNDSRFNSDTCELYLDILEHNDSFSFEVIVNVLRSNIIIENLANVFSPINNSNHIPNNCSNNASAIVLPQANIILSVLADNNDVNINDTICWTVNITNLGPDMAKDVIVIDILDWNDLEYISCNDSRFDIDSNKLSLGDMDSEDNLIFEIYTKVIKSGVNITNLVNVYSPTNNSDFVANNISANYSVKSKAIINIKVNKSSNIKQVNVGDKVIWNISVINKGFNTAHNVYAIDKIPYDLIFISSSSNVGTYDSISGKWLIGDLDPNIECILTIITKAIKSGNVTNVALVYLNDSSYDDNLLMSNCTVEVLSLPIDDIDDIGDDTDFDDGSDEVKNSSINDGKVKGINKVRFKNSPMENSGNPLVILFISLVVLSLESFRRKF